MKKRFFLRSMFCMYLLLLLFGSTGIIVQAQTSVGIEKIWGPHVYDVAEGVALSQDGSIYVVGYTEREGNDAFILKYAPDGSLQWQKTWGGYLDQYGHTERYSDHAYDVAVDQDGNAYVVGITQSFVSGTYPDDSSEAFILKYASDGTLVWQRTWGSSNSDLAKGVAVDQNNNIYVVGATYRSDSLYEQFLLKFDSDGDSVWARLWGTSGESEQANGVAVDQDGNIYVVGSKGTSLLGWWIGGTFLLKFSYSGNLLWEKTWGGNEADVAYDVATDLDGNVYVVGYTESFGLGVPFHPIGDAFILKYAPDGSLQWQKTWGDGGGEEQDEAYGVTVGLDGAIYVVGETSLRSSYDALILKYDDNGNLLWQKVWGNESAYDQAKDVASGSLCLVGETFSSSGPYTLASVWGNETIPSGMEADPDGNVTISPVNTNTPTGYETTPSGEPPQGGGDAFLISLVENDTDVDGLSDEEEGTWGTDPDNPDTDGDGLPDGTEVNVVGTDPVNSDTDGDGLPDGTEVNVVGTDPVNSDTDGDGLPDGTDPDPLDPAQVWSTNHLGDSQSTFLPSEEVYVTGNGFPENITVTIYVVPDDQEKEVGNAVSSVTTGTDANGTLPVSLLWSPPLSVGEYDIWVDVNQNGIYGSGDVLNNEAIDVFAFNVIPEPTILISILLMCGALAIFYFKKP